MVNRNTSVHRGNDTQQSLQIITEEVIQSSKHSRVVRNNIARMVCPALFEVPRYFRFGTDAETWLASVIYAEKLESRPPMFLSRQLNAT